MPDNRPSGRKRNITGTGSGAFKTGGGLGTGPVGSGPHPGGGIPGGQNQSTVTRRRRRGGGISIGTILLILVIYFLFFRGGSDDSYDYDYDSGYENDSYATDSDMSSELNSQSQYGSSLISDLTTDTYGDSEIYTDSNYSTGLSSQNALVGMGSSSVDTSVAGGARAKRTKINGDGSDKVTIMVYLCGTDLESKYGMASNDLAEMAQASLSDNVNIIVYTGGCKKWKTKGISNSVNQIYQIKGGGIKRLVEDDGSKYMTDPATLTGFINYCTTNYPANRNELILWDHGGGSVSGFGYDEKQFLGDAMDLAGIQKALKDSGTTFDFIGFDACLMATAETALMLDQFADYMIASEEVEPGIGWYYTNWLTGLSKNTGMPTVEIGKKIIDDYTATCDVKCSGSKTTLSIIDLAEFAYTVPDKLNAFAENVSAKVEGNDFKTVSDARYASKEFAQSSKIDQVDLADLAINMGSAEGRELSSAIEGAVKYYRNSKDMTFAHGVSIYFPYRAKSLISPATSTFGQIGLNQSYIKCIEESAAIQANAQTSSGSGHGLMDALFGEGASEESNDDYDYGWGDLLGDLFSERSVRSAFNTDVLQWTKNSDGAPCLAVSNDQWEQIHDVDLNIFLDDGAGYIDLGLDNVFEIDDDDNLVADTSGAWIGINGQLMPYYHTSTTDSGYEGYAPALLNGERVNLLLSYDNASSSWTILGASTDYSHNENQNVEVVAKNTVGLNVGDKIQFICDYYTYNMEYDDSYKFGNEITVVEDMKISDLYLPEKERIITYRLTDIYDRAYWTPKLVMN